MTFGDAEFLALFLPLAWIVHWLLPRRATLQNVWLLATSYVFFATWTPRLLASVVASTLVHFALVRWMVALRPPDGAGEDEARRAASRRRLALALGVAFSLAQLAAFKYLGFFAESFNALLSATGAHACAPVLRFVLPVGLSFWTLQQIAYLADVYDERDRGDASLVEYATFVALFPKLVAGPIVRGHELLPRLREPRALDLDALRRGCAALFRGFVAKYLVAATLGAALVDPVFAEPDRFSATAHWLALAGYAGQVFADFAGYSEMAIGCAALFGLPLPRNFNLPFLATSMLEFWRRWHMTLTSWLFDYVYSPLVTGDGSMRGRFDLGFLVVFAVSGLWHGATWAFVLWGALHGVALATHRRWDELYRGLCRKDRAWVARRKTPAYLAAAWAVTQAFFLVSLVPFRAGTLPATGHFTRGLITSRGDAALDVGTTLGALRLAVSVGLLVAWHLLGTERFKAWPDRLLALPAPVRGLAYGLLVVYLALFMPLTGAAFIYAQF